MRLGAALACVAVASRGVWRGVCCGGSIADTSAATDRRLARWPCLGSDNPAATRPTERPVRADAGPAPALEPLLAPCSLLLPFEPPVNADTRPSVSTVRQPCDCATACGCGARGGNCACGCGRGCGTACVDGTPREPLCTLPPPPLALLASSSMDGRRRRRPAWSRAAAARGDWGVCDGAEGARVATGRTEAGGGGADGAATFGGAGGPPLLSFGLPSVRGVGSSGVLCRVT